jgi:hypothetical protein
VGREGQEDPDRLRWPVPRNAPSVWPYSRPSDRRQFTLEELCRLCWKLDKRCFIALTGCSPARLPHTPTRATSAGRIVAEMNRERPSSRASLDHFRIADDPGISVSDSASMTRATKRFPRGMSRSRLPFDL